MFIILTSKPAQYHTEPHDAAPPRETWDYLFCGQPKASFVIAELLREVKFRVVDEAPPPVTSEVPSKFLPHFASVEDARRHLHDLVSSKGVDTALVRRP